MAGDRDGAEPDTVPAPVASLDDLGSGGPEAAAPIALFDAQQVGAARAGVAIAAFGEVAARRQRPRRRSGDDSGGVTGGVTGSSVEDPADRPRDRRGPSVGRRSPEPRRAGRDVDPGLDTAPDLDPGSGSDRPAGRKGSAGRDRGDRDRAADAGVDPVARARDICLRLLTDRARTRQELAQALRRKEIPDDAAKTVLERFDEVGLIDDAAFAGQWVRSRHNFRGLGRRAIAMELRRKGVADDVASDALEEVDADAEESRARQLVDRKLRSMAVDTREERAVTTRRLAGMLARKGYSAGLAYRVVREAIAARGVELEELDEVGDE